MVTRKILRKHGKIRLAAATCVLLILVEQHLVHSAGRIWSSRARISNSIAEAIPALLLKRASKDSWNERIIAVSTRIKKLPKRVGFFYGIPDEVMSQSKEVKKRKPRLSEIMSETLEEIRIMREEMTALRREINKMKQGLGKSDADADQEKTPVQTLPESGISGLVNRRKRQRAFDKIGMEVEQWAEKLLKQDGEEDGWKEVKCHKMFNKKFNKNKNIRCYLKWMKDSRGENAATDETEYPCIKCYATLDAPMHQVCAYLSDESRVPEYNDLVVKHRDLEEISPHSKITWGQCPKILFIKPRDFVTYCHHRWLRDGTQVVINQAVEHSDVPAVKNEKGDQACRAYALRGANFISQDPEDPNKTRFCLLAHADPGGGIPTWAMKTAVNALAPIEPFKLFYKINKNVNKVPPESERTEMVSTVTGRSARPAGLAQMGYACFWPQGGGLKEGILHHGHPRQLVPDEVMDEGQGDSSLTDESTKTEPDVLSIN